MLNSDWNLKDRRGETWSNAPKTARKFSLKENVNKLAREREREKKEKKERK